GRRRPAPSTALSRPPRSRDGPPPAPDRPNQYRHGVLAVERGIREYGNKDIRHNVEFTLHVPSSILRAEVPDLGSSLTARRIIKLFPGEFVGANLRPSNALVRSGIVRHGCTVADSEGSFWNAYIEGEPPELCVSRLIEEPFAMFECKRVGIEEGQKKGPQTIEKAKQGAYVARSVSGLQRIPLREGGVAGLVEEIDGTLTTHLDYYEFLRGAIDDGEIAALANVVLTVGVVSNHGNWFTADTQNKEMRVLAQSYDWLLFLTDSALAEFIQTTVQGTDAAFEHTRAAFQSSYATAGGSTSFTKVTIDSDADRELTEFFATAKPWAGWFNVIGPAGQPLSALHDDLSALAEIRGRVTG
ncbi:MAG: hypothetical protein ACYC90_14150, partial [Candidatus Nanopelagicales bacterium]